MERRHQAGSPVVFPPLQMEYFKPKYATIGTLTAVSGHLQSGFETVVHSMCTTFHLRPIVLCVTVETEKVRAYH